MGLVICHINKARKLREGEKSQGERNDKRDKISAGALVQQNPDFIEQYEDSS